MGNGGIGVGLLTVTFGGWLLYCAVSNQGPVKTLIAIAQDPTNARNILANKQNPLAASLPTTATTQSLISAPGNGAAVVAFARSKIGQPYVFGGAKDGGWDCSGLTQQALKYAYGINVAHGSLPQLLDPRGQHITSKANLQVGDLVFPFFPPLAGDHVQIYSGNGNIIEAPEAGKLVREVPMWGFYTARRFGPVSATASAA